MEIFFSIFLALQRIECKILIKKLPRSLTDIAEDRNISVTDTGLTLNVDQKCFKDHFNAPMVSWSIRDIYS
jgi:hypothetical protein